MLEFSEEFFRGEERDGFYIESLMKRNWAVSLDMLNEIARICERHNIRWFADSGTLLGAVRHKGFITWDDDIDIVMPREDMYRFSQIANQELPEYYNFSEGGVDANCIGSVVNNIVPHTRGAEFYEKVYYGMPYNINIDIYPLDDIAQDLEVRELQASVLNGLTAAFAMFENKLATKEECVAAYVQILEALAMPVDPDIENKEESAIKKMIWDTYNQVSQIANNTGSDEWCYPHWVAYREKRFFKKEWFREAIDLPFENITVKAPIGYEPLLEVCYGPNWRIPANVGSVHNYPGYNRERFRLEKVQAAQLLSQILAQTTGQSLDPETDYKQISYDDDFSVYEAEVGENTYMMIIPTFDFTKSDKYVYDENMWVEKKDKVCEQMKVVIYDGGANSFVCGIK